MTQLGMDGFIGILDDRNGSKRIDKSLDKKIVAAEIDHEANNGNGALKLYFEDDTVLSIFDDGQSCCETRYLTCDDELAHFVSERLVSVETRTVDEEAGPDDWGDHYDQQFVLITTTGGVITLCTHNEHNGYYGGFWMRAVLTQKEEV